MRSATVLLAVALALPSVAAPGERPRPSTLSPSSPCAFFRDHAWGKGLDDPATAMLWACEAVAARRDAGVPLGDRLAAVEFALARYRAALLVAAPGGEVEAARTSGALDALAGIADGF